MFTTSNFKDSYLEQISVKASFTGRQALMTRFNGSRLWNVRGRFHAESGEYTEVIAKGLTKSKAMQAAQSFVEFGF
jgi:hypothetical protein